MKSYGPTAFALFRIALGFYLFIHFTRLFFVGPELFSNEGVIKDASILPSYKKLPILLFICDSPLIINIFIGSLILSSILFTFGEYRRLNSFWLYYGLMCLLNRNPLISNPSIGYIGWILLACSTIPTGERLGFLLSEKERKAEKGHWEMPDALYYGMWIIVGVSYTASGLHKLQCPSWLDGTALHYVLSGPLVRPLFSGGYNPIVSFLLNNGFLITFSSYGSLLLELFALFLGTFYRVRKYYWIMFMCFHLGILVTVNFSDLTFGMLVAHLFTFDPSWFDFTLKFITKYDRHNRKIINRDFNNENDFNNKPLVQNIVEEVEKFKKESTSVTGPNMFSWSVYAILIVCLAILINSKNGLYESIIRMTDIAIDFKYGFGFLIISLGLLMILERIFPDQELKEVPGWWKWVFIINCFQLFSAVLATFTWEHWLQNTSYFTSTVGFHLRDHVSPFTGAVIAYVINQWLFYHWHKARHEVYFLWILFHQFHHSPSRIEAIVSFYKHPLEIMIDSQIMAILLYSILGLTPESSIWLSIFSGLGEYFYHMNIKTPRLIGYFFQRPESHRVHHSFMKRLHCPNYSDLSWFDILGGTFNNPDRMDDDTGFSPDKEIRRLDMLLFKDVMTSIYQDVFSDYKKFKKVFIRYIWYALVVWGTLNSTAFIAHHDGIKDIGFATVSSPLPLVFSAYNGKETFATSFTVEIEYRNGTHIEVPLDSVRYNLLGGAYNRRNVYGAIFSHGPFFDKEPLIQIRQDILHYAVCEHGPIIRELRLDGDVKTMLVNVFDRPQNNKRVGELFIDCDSK